MIAWIAIKVYISIGLSYRFGINIYILLELLLYKERNVKKQIWEFFEKDERTKDCSMPLGSYLFDNLMVEDITRVWMFSSIDGRNLISCLSKL